MKPFDVNYWPVDHDIRRKQRADEINAGVWFWGLVGGLVVLVAAIAIWVFG